MKIEYSDIINKHKNVPCVVALHGPSLDDDKSKIELLQSKNKVLRISVNEWYDHFSELPNYWVVSNGEFTIDASINGSNIWNHRKYPTDVFNKYKIPLLYNSTADLTNKDLIDNHLKCDYLPYDTKHFRGHRCREIIKNFKAHYEKNKNFNFSFYGNNSTMWSKPDVEPFNNWMKSLHGRIGGGWDLKEKCCDNMQNITIQEELQRISGHPQHAGTGQTVGLFALMFAVIMGCNPIYVSGLDLDCSLGHADGSNPLATYNNGHIGHWKVIFKNFLLDDMRIINESDKLLGIKIVNLNKNSWHNVFLKDNLSL